jgi:hypothetical protein
MKIKILKVIYVLLLMIGYAVCSILDQQPAEAPVVTASPVEQGPPLHVIDFNEVPTGTYIITLRLDEGPVEDGSHRYLYQIKDLSGEQFKVRFESNPEDVLQIGAEFEVFPNKEVLIVKN